MMRDRQRGTLIGLAVGDALGAAVEFHTPGTFRPVTGYRGDGPHGLRPGEWTDDTSMALALADSIATAGWDAADQMRRYVAWYRDGDYSVIGRCFDIGVTTAEALTRFERGTPALECGDEDEYSAMPRSDGAPVRKSRTSGTEKVMFSRPVPSAECRR